MNATRRPLRPRDLQILALAASKAPEPITTAEIRAIIGSPKTKPWAYVERLVNRGLLRVVKRGHYQAVQPGPD